MLILIPISIVVAGLALAGRVVYKKMPQDLNEWDAAVKSCEFGPTFYQKTFNAAAVRSRQAVLGLSTKLVYRLKITSLKSDNFLTKILNEIREHKANTLNELSAEPAQEIKLQVLASEKTGLSFEPQMTASFKTLPVNEEDNSVDAIDQIKEELTSFAAQEQQYINQLAYNPKDVSVYKRLGWLYLGNSMPIQARQSFKMAVKLGSKDKIIMAKMLEMGGVLHKEGRGEYNPSGVSASKLASKPAVSKSTLVSFPTTKKTKTSKTRRLKVTKV